MSLSKNDLELVIKSLKCISFAVCVAFSVAGCATQSAHVRIDPSLQGDIRTFDGSEYLPMAALCDAYRIDYSFDKFARTANAVKGSRSIVVRDGSDIALVDGSARKLERPVVLSSGSLFIPLSCAKSCFAPLSDGLAQYKETAQKAPAPSGEPKAFAIKTVVIDPGHGGRDVGAVGRRLHLREKRLALDMAKKLKAILERAGMKVIMTRASDTFIPLSKRASIANRSRADLFVSVHINASRSKSLRGFECYFLSNATDDNARALEALENSSIRLSDGAGAEHSRQLDRTLWDMRLSENRAESADLAGYICDAVKKSGVVDVRGVRSARFYVLKNTRMPSVLTEACYISNRYDELKIKDPDFTDKLAAAIAEGIFRYSDEYERTKGYTGT
jgi:N-acetylmuramoyl-L-alanine amidase